MKTNNLQYIRAWVDFPHAWFGLSSRCCFIILCLASSTCKTEVAKDIVASVHLAQELFLQFLHGQVHMESRAVRVSSASLCTLSGRDLILGPVFLASLALVLQRFCLGHR